MPSLTRHEAKRLGLLGGKPGKRPPRRRPNDHAWELEQHTTGPGMFLSVFTANPLNGTTDRWGKVRLAKANRRDVNLLVTVRVGLYRGLPAVVTLTRYSPGELDDDGLTAALKNVRDGVADALRVDDRDPRVTWRYAQARGKGYGVRIQIEPREQEKPDAQ